MVSKGKRVLFITPYPHGVAGSQRFRFEQYLELLRQHGISYDQSPFIDEACWKIIYQPGNISRKMAGFLRGIGRRIGNLLQLGRYDFVFIHRELSPLGPPLLEWIVCKVLRKKVIFDFDDAIWIPNNSTSNSFLGKFKRFENANTLCKWAYKVSCGNNYLCQHAGQYNENVVYNPTTIDTEHHHNRLKEHHPEQFVLGWTGTHSTMRYLDKLIPVLKKLEEQIDFRFVLIADQQPSFALKGLEYVKWNSESEITDLLRMDVGLMPLENDSWANGKCGFKALQYMSLGIPALVSPVGINTSIVDHGINGFHCETEADWERAILKLYEDRELLKRMAAQTRQKVVEKYSVKSNSDNFLSLFETA